MKSTQVPLKLSPPGREVVNRLPATSLVSAAGIDAKMPELHTECGKGEAKLNGCPATLGLSLLDQKLGDLLVGTAG